MQTESQDNILIQGKNIFINDPDLNTSIQMWNVLNV